MFNHPLARTAKVWPMGSPRDKGQPVLVIVTKLKLDAAAKGFKAEKVEALSVAATEWISYHQDAASSFILVNPSKHWY